MNYARNDGLLNVTGYEIHVTRFADSILKDKFGEAKQLLEGVLSKFHVSESQVIEGGGGKSAITQSLADLLIDIRWKKETFNTNLYFGSKLVPKETLVAKETIELDHYKVFPNGSIGLKMLWNTKDQFFYNNLEYFKKLHAVGAIGIGILITKGKSLQDEMFFVYQRFLQKHLPLDVRKLEAPLSLSLKARKDVGKLIEKQGDGAINEIANYMTNSKFGVATTHMEKLFEQLDARIGDPCPLILIGIGKQRLIP